MPFEVAQRKQEVVLNPPKHRAPTPEVFADGIRQFQQSTPFNHRTILKRLHRLSIEREDIRFCTHQTMACKPYSLSLKKRVISSNVGLLCGSYFANGESEKCTRSKASCHPPAQHLEINSFKGQCWHNAGRTPCEICAKMALVVERSSKLRGEGMTRCPRGRNACATV